MKPHPATYPYKILDHIEILLHKYNVKGLVLDPFGGTGRLGLVYGIRAVVVDIEPEWVAQAHGNGAYGAVRADSRALPFGDGVFDGVATSPVYGNRMSDHDASQLRAGGSGPKLRSDAVRSTYTAKLGRRLTRGNAGEMYFSFTGKRGQEYRELHKQVWEECFRVLKPGGYFFLNVKDFIHNGKKEYLCTWHYTMMVQIGFMPVETVIIEMAGNHNTVNMRKQGLDTVDHEEINVWRKV